MLGNAGSSVCDTICAIDDRPNVLGMQDGWIGRSLFSNRKMDAM